MQELAKAEAAAFEASLIGLSDDEIDKRRADRLAEQKERQAKQEEERRHQDICDAIESTSFWNFGSSKRSRW